MTVQFSDDTFYTADEIGDALSDPTVPQRLDEQIDGLEGGLVLADGRTVYPGAEVRAALSRLAEWDRIFSEV